MLNQNQAQKKINWFHRASEYQENQIFYNFHDLPFHDLYFFELDTLSKIWRRLDWSANLREIWWNRCQLHFLFSSLDSLVLQFILLTFTVPCISESCIEIKIKSNFYFLTTLWCLKRVGTGRVNNKVKTISIKHQTQ